MKRSGFQQIRRRFQQRMRDDFEGVVERATGRSVRVFLSETHIDHDVSVETFLGELYEQAVGTESEQSRYAQLRAASVRVARYERLAEVSPAPAHSEPA